MKSESLAAIVPVMGGEYGFFNFARASNGGETRDEGLGWWYIGGTRYLKEAFWPLIAGLSENVRPIHHRGDGEVAGEGSGI